MPWRRLTADTPKDRLLWIYWPIYHCPSYGDNLLNVVAVAEWKHNGRITDLSDEDNILGLIDHYWSDILDEYDDYGLAHPDYQPTHWRPYLIPKPPQNPIGADT
jgi:hypothetical protein